MRNSASSSSGKCGKILLVDDHKDGLAARRSVLQELGHCVTTATSGAAALELAAAQSFDLLITDWKMPKMDGVELIRHMRAQGFAGPAILLSGHQAVQWLKEDECGADVIVQKNATEITQLVSGVKRLLNKKPVRKPPARHTIAEVDAGKTAKSKSKIS
jgi:CheY-like chemotaxis protein